MRKVCFCVGDLVHCRAWVADSLASAINAYDLFNDILFYIFARAISKVKVTVNEKPSATLDQEILNSIWKQAGWK